jgi:PAS domain S-box-containing protein
MTGIRGQALLTVLLGCVAFVWVAKRANRNELRGPLLAVLGFLIAWMSGRGLMETPDADGLARVGLMVSYFGACGLGPAWLVLCARFTRSQLFERQPGLFAVAGVPPAIAYLAMLTNEGHRLWADSLDPQLMRTSPADWGGPIFWMALAWQIVLVVTGSGLLLRSTSLSIAQRRRSRLVGLMTILPIGATLVGYLDLLPIGTDPVPLMSAITVAAIIVIAIRYRLLDFLPLARRDVIDALSDAVILTDADGAILDLNPAAVDVLGSRRRPMRDRPLARVLSRLVPDDEMSPTERNLENALASAESVALSLHTREQRDLEIQIGSVRDAGGEPSARFAVVRDVTESRRYERLLRESQQRVVVGGLAAGLAHEVNNPLAFVASNLHQVHRMVTFSDEELESFEKHRAEELSELAEVVGETIDGVERIAEIVGRIIRPGTLSEDDLVRLEMGRVIEDAVRLVELHGESAVRTCVESSDLLPQIEGCPERLSQALLNLLLNAQQLAGRVPDASLFIETAGDRDGIAVRVGIRDGRGEPFRGALPAQAATGSTAEAELSAAYETVREHGGALESGTEPGVLFVMRLPAAA